MWLASFGDNSGSGSRAQSACSLINVWLNSSLHNIPIGKLEIQISIANVQSWPDVFIILFNSMLPC